MNNIFNSLKNFYDEWYPKVVIIGVYLLIIAAFLYSPRVFEYFSNEQSINVYAFTEFVSSEAVKEFEHETGIKVRIQYFEFNEELYAKFKINHGEGYDLITPSDYMVEMMRKDGMLQEIDHSKLSNIKELDSRLLGKYFDPENKYSIPICWLVYGIVYDRDIVGPNFKQANLGMLFKDPWDLVISDVVNKHYRVCMAQDPRDMVYLAAIYLYGRTENLTDVELAQIQDLLSKQKGWVESYTDAGTPYFLTGGIASVALISNHRMKKLQEISNKFIFQIPKDGSIMVIENIAIPVKTKKSDLVHKFIDFLISKKIAMLHANLYGTNSSNISVFNEKVAENSNFFPKDTMFDKLHLINNEISLDRVDSIWLGVRFS
ncbi:MAG: extracellular solute-binding protein [Candidatus Babeliales bacterium]|jgi:spermidine/putrescine transport system substrate-binding protein